MTELTLSELLLLAFIVVGIVSFTVWFGGWMSKSMDESMDLKIHDEHEDFLRL